MSAYLDTRVSLFAERLWRDEELDALIAQGGDEAIETLVRRGLRDVPIETGIPAGERGDAGSLEQSVIAQLLEETRILIRPLSGEARSFLSYWTARFEISNVKTLLRSKMTGERAALALARLTPMGAFGRLDLPALAHAEDVGELLRRLEAGPYAGVVRHARRAFEQSGDPFSLDAALDRGYYEGLVQRARPLEEKAGASFRTLIAQLIDRINLVWLLRYRFNYGLPPAQVYYLLVGSPYTLDSARLQKLAALDSFHAVIDALPPEWYARIAGAQDIPEVFARMEQAAAEQARRVLRSRAPAIARAFAYLVLRERDLRGVRGILRGGRLGLSGELVRQALHRPPAGVQ
jgi:V/A-type H+-transporting ATPase subunit C